jgi:hypothetical protein
VTRAPEELDLCRPHNAVTVIDDVLAAAYRPDFLITADRSATLRVFERGSSWRETRAWSLPDELRGAEQKRVPTNLQLSASGRYLLAQIDHAFLIELDGWRVRRSIPLLGSAFGHASFTRSPSGADLLFIAAESHMGLQVIDCASGELMRSYQPHSSFDFCHTQFELSADGSRLFSFGCSWAAPYSARIYDFGPWLKATVPSSDSKQFPLPIVFSRTEGEIHQLGDVLPMRASPGLDGCVTCVTTVAMQDVPDAGSDEDLEWRAQDPEEDRTLLSDLQERKRTAAFALIVRRVDPETGRTVGRFLYGTGDAVAEQNIHILSDHRVLIVNRRICVLDGLKNTVDDLGPFVASTNAPRFETLVSNDLALLVATHALE